ncbi:synaptotagmin-2-like [Ptychodera flava]|uniref:synaptotagmin-2-like n=1 Tax=Ptychodera flava TaxID=63121 RepID=UPI00396A2573
MVKSHGFDMEAIGNSAQRSDRLSFGKKPSRELPGLPYAVIGGVIILGIVIAIMFYLWRRRETKGSSQVDEGDKTPRAIIKMDQPPPFIIPSLTNPEFAKEFDTTLFQRRESLQPIAFSLSDIKPVDYQPCSDKTTFTPSKFGLGKLCFSVFYDEESEQLTFFLIRAVHLPAKNMRGTADPYVKITLLPDKSRKIFTKVHRKTLNPIFNENFVFTFPPTSLKSRVIRLVVYDFDRFSRPTVIGHVMVSLGDIDFKPPRCGEEHVWRDLKEAIPSELKRGEILISLTYLPNAERLTVVLLKARELNLPASAKTDEDVRLSIKLTMVTGGRLMKTKRTAVIRKEARPEFNEAFSMELAKSNTSDTCIVAAMQYQSGSFGYPKVLGRVVVGANRYSTGDGLAHWNEMMTTPRSAVVQWHALL